MVAFLKHFALPNVGLFNHLVPWGEFAIGLGLILGCLTTTTIFFAMFMCFMFAFSGTVSTTPWVFLLGMFIIVSGDNAGAIGLDRWVQPFLRAKFHKKS